MATELRWCEYHQENTSQYFRPAVKTTGNNHGFHSRWVCIKCANLSRDTGTQKKPITHEWKSLDFGILPFKLGKQQKIRDGKHGTVQDAIKKLYGRCEVKGCTYKGEGGMELNGSHIIAVAVGGPASTDNQLCLCPNHHAIFKLRVFDISELRILPGHNPAPFLERERNRRTVKVAA